MLKAVKCGTSLYVEQLSVTFNGVIALQNWKDPQNTMYMFSLRAHQLTCVDMWDGTPTCLYIVSLSINLQIPISDFHAFCDVPVRRICLNIKFICFQDVHQLGNNPLNLCTCILCGILRRNWVLVLSEIKIK